VVTGCRCALLQSKQVEACDIRNMRCRPTVVTIANARRDSLSASHRNQRCDQALLYGVVDLRQAHHRGVDSALHECDCRRLRYTRKGWGRKRRIVLGSGTALSHSDPGTDDERTA